MQAGTNQEFGRRKDKGIQMLYWARPRLTAWIQRQVELPMTPEGALLPFSLCLLDLILGATPLERGLARGLRASFQKPGTGREPGCKIYQDPPPTQPSHLQSVCTESKASQIENSSVELIMLERGVPLLLHTSSRRNTCLQRYAPSGIHSDDVPISSASCFH